MTYHLSERTDGPITVYERGLLAERGPLAGETTARSAAFFGFYGSDLERRLKRYGMALYSEFLAEPRHDLVGRLRVAATGAGADALAERAWEDWADDRVVIELREEDRLVELVAGVVLDGVAGATYRPGVGYHRPRELACEFVVRAADRGVALETGTSVIDIVVEADRVRGSRSSRTWTPGS